MITEKQRRLTSLSYGKHAKRLAAAFDDGFCAIWSSFSVQESPMQFRLHQKAASSLHFTLCSSFLLSASHDKCIKLWHCPEPEQVMRSKPRFKLCLQGHTNWVNEARFNSNDTLIASCSDDGTIKIWNVEATKAEKRSAVPVRTFSSHQCAVKSLCFFEQNTILSGDEKGVLNVYDIRAPRAGLGMSEPQFSPKLFA